MAATINFFFWLLANKMFRISINFVVSCSK
ncbi:hypothetical protein Golob_023930 [Gossypium lobatum]|uniref:Uncharacterized protein n=1 Tax=Gossypium lobatum TaxID=34289 RepID=A0A7J8NM00_9ROSI|nr:hypothetical protein [Gossypium lobatum]